MSPHSALGTLDQNKLMIPSNHQAASKQDPVKEATQVASVLTKAALEALPESDKFENFRTEPSQAFFISSDHGAVGYN